MSEITTVHHLCPKQVLKTIGALIVYNGLREQIIIKKGSRMKSSTFSLFAQVLGLVDRRKFDALASEDAVEKSSKGFGSWLQFVAMLFAQLSDAASLREISLGLASASGKLRHLGVDSAPSPSTLAYANAHGDVPIFVKTLMISQHIQSC